MQTVSVDSLVFSDSVNCRVTDRVAGVEALAASISAHGLLNPIGVRPIDGGKFEVVDGNRRATAVKLLRERGQWPADVEVNNLGSMSDEDAMELSLAGNVMRADIHPIDEYEAFARLAKTMKVAEIAEHFGKTEKEVRKSLALGDLHPDLRALWRAGEIREEAVCAFTLCKDQATQIEIYSRLKAEGRGVWGNTIRAALGIDHDAESALAIVGVEAYQAAGGTITEDLFGDGAIPSDADLAKRLLAEKVQKVCADLRADGWSFAVLRGEVKNPWGWAQLKPSGKRQPTEEEQADIDSIKPQIEALQEAREKLSDNDEDLSDEQEELLDSLNERLEKIEAAIDARRWGARQKKGAGCFVWVDREGVNIDYGRVDPKAKKAADKGEKPDRGRAGDDEGDEGAEAGGKISIALNLALTEQLTVAASRVLATDPGAALVIAVAAMEAGMGSSPAKIRIDGAPCVNGEISSVNFAELLVELLNERQEDVQARLASAIAQSLDFRNFNGGVIGENATALLRALSAPALRVACAEAFDAAHYFKGVKADLCNAALDEMGVEAKGRPKKKGELAELCAKAAKEREWFPRQMWVYQAVNEGAGDGD